MNIEQVLSKLEEKGLDNDLSVTKRADKYLNITKDTGEFLNVLVKALRPRRVLEIGTSNGYSTIWMASGVPEGGQIVTVDSNPKKLVEAEEHFREVGLSEKITVVLSDSSEYLRSSVEGFDLIFLDGDRNTYLPSVGDILRLLRCGGLIVCDNAISHRNELQTFMDYIDSLDGFTTALVPVGKGEYVIHKPSD